MIADRLRLLGIVLGALVFVLLLEWVWPEGSAAGAGRLGGLHLTQAAPKAALQARAAADWAATELARPLFSISRKPPRVEASAGTAAAPDAARLSGILIGSFGKRAIFAPEGGGKPLVLGEGAAINESVIRSIEPGQVVLASGTVLTPSFDKNRVPSAPFSPGFQPIMPNFQPPGFPNGLMPQPGFPGQRSLMPQPPPNGEAAQDGAQNVPVPGVPTPVPVFRGPMIPQRRE
jgi:hypothetical protein